MRLAVLSDVHGNARALAAAVADVATRGVDRIVNLGDCLYGPFDPRPVADRLMDAGWATVAGNEDRILLEALAGHRASRTARYTVDRLGRGHRQWLRTLPRTVAIDDVAFAFHGAPTDDTVYLLSRPIADGTMRRAMDDEIVEALGPTDEALILCGHDHLPRVVRLDDGRTIVNPGSVGCPAYTDAAPIPHRVENGTPHARYAIVTCDTDSFEIEPIAVAYDWVSAACEAEENGFPDWARWIATGRATS